MANATHRPEDFATRLGHVFKRPELLIEALTHQSAADTGTGARESYERLEFLGDRVLGLVVADMLSARFAVDSIGDLARRHVELVRAEALTRVARNIGLEDFILLSPGEQRAGARASASIQSDAMEAVLAALYLDGGLEAAARFIEAQWEPMIEGGALPPLDPKTALQEWLQAKGKALPDYAIVDKTGPDHLPVFTIELKVEGEQPLCAKGGNRRVAESEAAAQMLARLAGNK